MNKPISPRATEIVLKMQQNELTESVIYEKIARFAKGNENRETLLRLAREERAHYEIWKKYTGVEMKPEKAKVLKFTLIARILGFTFAVKLMEKGTVCWLMKWRKVSTSASRKRNTSMRCLPCWTKSGCAMWAAWFWASTMPWWS